MCFYDLGVPFFVPFGVAVSKRRFLDRCEEGIALLSLYFTLCASIGLYLPHLRMFGDCHAIVGVLLGTSSLLAPVEVR